MNILYISYWGFAEGLTQATAIPHLRILAGFTEVRKITFVTIEREQRGQFEPHGIPKVVHIPFYSVPRRFHLDKIHDFTRFPVRLVRIIREEGIDKIICRGAPAGALGYLAGRKTDIPFFVESFEPHSAYMLEAGVWRRWDPRFILQMRWEEKQKRYAIGLMPVSESYRTKLIAEGIPEDKIRTVPCGVDPFVFGFDPQKREKTRNGAGISADDLVGIYVGKFGGNYYDREAFHIFREAFGYFGDRFRLVILSPDKMEFILQRAAEAGIDPERVICKNVPHPEVPCWLSAGDFAFATYKASPSKRYLSPIKVGEYWANGLPVLLTEGVGDDAEIIRQEGGGALFSLGEKELRSAFVKIEELLQDRNHRKSISLLALKYRSFERVRQVYSDFFRVA
jgi:hypothetical protein